MLKEAGRIANTCCATWTPNVTKPRSRSKRSSCEEVCYAIEDAAFDISALVEFNESEECLECCVHEGGRGTGEVI